MWADSGRGMRDKQFAFCLDAAVKFQQEGRLYFSAILQAYPHGKNGDWTATPGRLAAMILQASDGFLTPVFADYHPEEFLVRVSRLPRRKSHQNRFVKAAT